MQEIFVEFTWLPAEAEFHAACSEELNSFKLPVKSLKKFLSRLFDFPVDILEAKRKINTHGVKESSTSMFFAEYLYSVICKIKFECNASTSNIADKLKKLIKSLCSQSNSDFPELCLNNNALLTFENNLNTVDHFIDLKSFSLGNIVKLNKYVEHFNSENSLNQYKYKITQTKVKFLHDEEMFYVNFVVGKAAVSIKKRNASTHRMFRLSIPYSSVHSVVICDSKCFSVYIRLFKTPLLYTVKQDEDSEAYVSYLDLAYNTCWIRTINLYEGCPSNIRKEFTMNSVLCLNFHKEDYEILKIALRHKSIQMYFSFMNVIPYKPIQLSLQITDFNSCYAYQCLLTHSHEILDQLMLQEEIAVFRDFMIEKSQENGKALSESLYKIHSAISKCNVVILNYSLKYLYEKLSKIEKVVHKTDEKNFQKNVLHVKRAIIIPTHIRFLPPQPILKSRALRSCNPDYSLRVSIRDANLETINISFRGIWENKLKFLTDFFEKYYKKTMLNGIKVGKHIYMYVGGSTSQLRGHGLWFYAKDDEGKTATNLREDFGNMDKIKQVPKYMARMGQTFSQARGHIKVPQEYTNIDCPDKDIEGGIKVYLSDDVDDHKNKFLKTTEECERDAASDEPYTFSDGIGCISLEIAEEVYEALNLEDKPSAMQIRYAGCKGMLVVDPKLKGKQIRFRESMKKFISTNDSLEIIKVSEKRAASLNRPLITILEQLGVPKDVFVKLQKEMIQNHIKSMFYEPEACEFLNRNSKLRFDYNGMHNVGIGFTEDPLFRSMIYALFQKQLDLLKHKANVEIPVNKGRAMFGVLDETFTLEYGQVFVQYTDWNSDEAHIIEGTIVVTKNPCMHPGDVRKFQAVNVKDLHHIRDCIVFPAKGERPHPDEMAGSDLDGDEYHVMWYEDFFFERDNEPPMHFAVRKDNSRDLQRSIEPADELDHLCNYIANDNVGLFANAHLVFADREKKGIFGENCIRLAKKYAVALDFAKSGKIATRSHNDRVFTYPDFMEKFGEKSTYISKNVLGVLFRNCKRLELGLEATNTEVEYNLDNDLLVENWRKYEKSALKTYKYYCRKMDHLMNLYSFSNEGELLAGAIINPPRYYEQRHDLDNLMVLLEHEVQWIFLDFEKIFFQEFGGKPKHNHFTTEMYQKASAWYNVAYGKVKGKRYNFFGLPWAVADVLIDLKKKKCRLKKNRIGNSKSLLENILDESLMKHMPNMSKEMDISEIYENRLEILDVAHKVLNEWLKTQRSHVLIEDLKKFEKLIDIEFDAVSQPLACCDLQYISHLKETNNIKKAMSPSYYVIETLVRLSCMKIHKTSFNNSRQELSLLSWVTLIKLACTYNPNYLGIADKDGNLPTGICFLPQDTVVSTFKIYLFHKNDYNEEFSLKLLHTPDEVTEYLRNVSKLKEMNFRYDIDRDKKFVAIFTVMGSRYAIEKLKDLVIQDEFFKWVVQRKELFAS